MRNRLACQKGCHARHPSRQPITHGRCPGGGGALRHRTATPRRGPGPPRGGRRPHRARSPRGGRRGDQHADLGVQGRLLVAQRGTGRPQRLRQVHDPGGTAVRFAQQCAQGRRVRDLERTERQHRMVTAAERRGLHRVAQGRLHRRQAGRADGPGDRRRAGGRPDLRHLDHQPGQLPDPDVLGGRAGLLRRAVLPPVQLLQQLLRGRPVRQHALPTGEVVAGVDECRR